MKRVEPKIMARIRKLHALGTSHQPHEAALALQKAAELMAKHGVTEEELRLSAVEEQLANSGRAGQNIPAWHWLLARLVADAFGLKAIWVPRLGFVFVGLSWPIQVGTYVYEVLLRKCLRARRAYLSKLRGKRGNRIRKADDYACGWVCIVGEEIERFAQPVPEVVTEYLDKKAHSLQKATPIDRGRDKDRRHFMRGVVDGADVELQRGVENPIRNELEG